MTEPINKIPKIPQLKIEPQHKYEVMVRDLTTGEIIYLNESNAGVCCTMEKLDKLGAVIEGQHQNFGWGNPYLQWYTFDQLSTWFKTILPEVFKEAQRLGVVSTDFDLEELFKGKN